MHTRIRGIIANVRHSVKLNPVRVATWDTDWQVTRLHLIGYRAECSCGERSKVKRKRHDLRTWQRAHLSHVA